MSGEVKQNRPFWDWMMNLKITRWFLGLSIVKKLSQHKLIKLLFNYEMITYVFFGVLTTVINLVVFWLFCLLLGVPMTDRPSPSDALPTNIANSVAFVLSLIFAFFVNKLIVFKSNRLDAKTLLREMGAFALARVFSFGCETLIMTLATLTSFSVMIAKVIAQVVVVILNYIASKLFVFKNKTAKEIKDDAE